MSAVNPLVVDGDWRSTVENCSDVLRCLDSLSLDQLCSQRAENGLTLIHRCIASALDAISERQPRK